MIEAIRERRSLDDVRHRAYLEWQTKSLASFIACTAQSEKGARELQKAAQQLSMSPESPDDKQTHSAPPRVGSFEKLAGLFGGGRAS